ncbi:hypothetical protein [Propionivibrio sp.]|uniref:hypothetical protein n=1 Tax=Propionivibrio sp. TaxID=2212460 RepID=UPI0025DB006E|nr:hypothetical protein [Propionivibrio sp.]MBK7357174.1 hypothetical protein [Propionivibrio sp.]
MTDTQTVVWAIVIVLALAIMSFTIVGGIAFFRAGQGQAKSFGLMFERGNFLRLAAAVLIILATILLAALGKLTAEGVASILSGVAGYVLGGMDKQQQNQAPDKSTPKGGE